MSSINVAMIDDHKLAIAGIKTMLSTFPHINMTDTYSSCEALMEGLEDHQPDVLLLDILLPDGSGKELTGTIAKKYPNVKMIALTSLDAPVLVKYMMQHGCLGYLLKDTDEETLVTAIEHAYRGEEYIEPTLKEHLVKSMMQKKPSGFNTALPNLTEREKEIMKLIVAEYTTQEIADKLYIGFRTVESHRYTLLQKLGVKNTAGLVKMAIMMGMAD